MANYLKDAYEEQIRPCIDLIDSLRSLGVEKDLALPAITVIGDQSSGKSSVLEALSGITLPRGNGIVTRCPLELKLIKGLKDSTWRGKISYEGIIKELDNPMKVQEEIMEAQDLIAGTELGISSEVISLEVVSPDVPDLTIIDLPGIARVPVGNQPDDIGDQTKILIKKYINKPETICLVVVPCNVDIATTEALEMAREVDPSGERTLGILTKPDLIDKGTEMNVVNVVNNKVIHLKKGYMIVKCRGQQEIQNGLSLKKAIQMEDNFFKNHAFFSHLEEKATIPRLAKRLTSELVEHIKKSLPALEDQIKNKLQITKDELEKCGEGVPKDESEGVAFLVEKIQQCNLDIAHITQGEEFESLTLTPKLYARVRTCFNTWQEELEESISKFNTIIKDKLEEFEKFHRGRELPGFINYKMFEALIKEMIGDMEDPAKNVLETVTDIVKESLNEIAETHFHSFPNLCKVTKAIIENLRQSQKEAAEDLIKIQFTMEQMVYSQEKRYRYELETIYKNNLPPYNHKQPLEQQKKLVEFLQCPVMRMTHHIEAFLKGFADRFANQIPLIIQFYALQEYGKQLQKEMWQLLTEKNKHESLLEESNDLASTRTFLKHRMQRLSEARKHLLSFRS